ncbi:transferase hexapeptide (six repeat-containing protein) [Pseudobutyrivibrio sp. YE44]|uniref:CatB-related O-acetyltransferase n=1 Tax=Pseudobutyrivibrio sp. YE44 TaxID=1520802 RepID=UPI00087F9831|nr:CatB-related O-acetyltransferase [Pseudobutyrivibrio sp. YE44]SDB28924.1 transferase hexapeptide (six repeat-containing protein) [Pseudobutyrivibrio sp. YE44]
MELVSFADKVIKDSLEKGVSKFIICPFGERGMRVKNVLNIQFDIQEYLIVDNGLSIYNKNVLAVRDLKDNDVSDSVILLTSKNADIYNELTVYIDESNIVSLVDDKSEKKNKVGRFSYGPLVDNYEPLIDSIGSFCSFAPGCCVVGNHLLDAVSTHEFLFEFTNCKELQQDKEYTWESINKKVVIGNDVWFGQNVVVTNGARIGNGVIAGAGSIITKDIPDYAVVVGNPARIIRYRFNEKQIAALNKLAWWDWPIEKIKMCYKDFYDIDKFIKRYGADYE